jgi:hypothetical protein
MPWVTQRTWTDGEVVTASQLNVQIRDDLSFLYSAPRCHLVQTKELTVAADAAAIVVDYDVVFENNDDMRSMSANTQAVLRASGFPDGGFIFPKTAGRYLLSFTGSVHPGGVVGCFFLIEAGSPSGGYQAAAGYSNPKPVATTPWDANVTTIWNVSSVSDDSSFFVLAGAFVAGNEISLPSKYPSSHSFVAHWLGG